MRKIITTFLLLWAAVWGTVSAATTNYDLYVAGTQVTSSNAKKVVTGVSYDASNKILTLDNATISTSADQTDGIYNSGIDGLTILVKGSCRVSSTNGHGICMANNTTILGDDFATLTVEGSQNNSSRCGIWMKNGNTLTIEQVWLYVYGGYSALAGTFSTHNEALNLKRCNVYAKLTNSSATGSAVAAWKSITTWGVTYDWNGSKYDTTNYKMTTSSGNNSKEAWMVGRLTIGRYIIDPRNSYTIDKSTPSSGITAGTIKWVPTSQELQMDNVTMTDYQGCHPVAFFGYSSGSNPLDIWLIGTNTIKATKTSVAIRSYKNKLFIDGQSRTAAKLTINNTAGKGINTQTADLQIGTVGMTINSKDGCIQADGSQILSIGESGSGSKLDLTSSNGYAIYGFKTCTMTSDATSNGTYYNAAKYGFTAIGGTLASTVNIDQPTTIYDCKIYGYEVNNVNCNNFACEGIEAGTIKWDNANRILTLNGVTMNNTKVTNQAAINPGGNISSTTTINISGKNTIKGGHSSLYPGGNLIISGTGDLTCENTGSYGALLAGGYNATVTIDVNGKVFMKGPYGYNSNVVASNATNKLVLKKAGASSDYTFDGTKAAIIGLYGGLTLYDDEMDFYSDSRFGGAPGCYFDEEDHRVEQNGGTTAKKVNFYKVSERYGVYVAGTRVTNCNSQGIGSKYFASGTESAIYYGDTNTLTLDNANITMDSNDNAIENISEEGLTISLKGTNRLSQNNSSYAVIGLSKTTTIKGSTGSKLYTQGNTNMGINSRKGADLTIKDTEVTMENRLYSNDGAYGSTLTIDNATVEVNSSVDGFKNVYLANTYLIEPKSGKYDTSKHYVSNASGGKASYVLFGPQELLGIENMEAEANDGGAEVRNIFDASGAQQQELQRGINIVRMSDGTVRKVVRK